jgi:hypothetical protein
MYGQPKGIRKALAPLEALKEQEVGGEVSESKARNGEGKGR